MSHSPIFSFKYILILLLIFLPSNQAVQASIDNHSQLPHNFASNPEYNVVTCSASGNDTWTTTSNEFAAIRSCSLFAPVNGYVFISASASAILSNDATAYEAQFRLGVDNLLGLPSTERWVNVYAENGFGSYQTVSVSTAISLTAGMHTIYFLGDRSGGSGAVNLTDPSLSIIFIPAPSPLATHCQVNSDTSWSTTSPAFQTIQSCTLTTPEDGIVLISASASVGLAPGDASYEGRFRLGVDGSSLNASDRWINIYADLENGADQMLDVALLYPVTAGPHTFDFYGTRYHGSGAVHLHNPGLSVIFFPTSNALAMTCTDVPATTWTSASIPFQAIRSCELTLPRPALVLLLGGASAGLVNNTPGSAYEAQFRLGIDDTQGITTTDRWLNTFTDGVNGADRPVFVSQLQSVDPGLHTFYFLGRQHSGGSVQLYAPSLQVIAFTNVKPLFLPIIQKQ